MPGSTDPYGPSHFYWGQSSSAQDPWQFQYHPININIVALHQAPSLTPWILLKTSTAVTTMDMMNRATPVTLPLELIDCAYTDIPFMAAQFPSTAPRQKIFRSHHRKRLKLQHQQPPRLLCDGTLVVTYE